MNLVNGDWIPVIDNGGLHRLLSLKAIYSEAAQISDLSVTPPQRIALMRLLICITQAALDGPKDEKDWKSCKPRIARASVKYLIDNADKFYLYGDRAFLQIVGLESSNYTVNDKLDFRLAAGNNSVLFDHAANKHGRPHDDAWYALMILTYQAFSTSGLVSKTVWAGESTGRSSAHAPCIEGAAIHTLLRSQNLLDSIHMNLLTKTCIEDYTSMGWGKPSWELPPKSPEDKSALDNTSTFLGRLVPYSRAILLDKGQKRLILGNGLSYPRLPVGREVTATVLLKSTNGNETYSYLRLDISKHPWRELSSILTFTRRKNSGCALPLYHLNPESNDTTDIWTGGMMPDPSKAGKILDVAEWTFSIPQSILESSALKRYEEGVKLAGLAEWTLANGVKKYCAALKKEDTFGPKARIHFWSILDGKYMVLIQVSNSTEITLGNAWYPIVRDAMRRAYADTCPHDTPRQLQAFARGQQLLRFKRPQL